MQIGKEDSISLVLRRRDGTRRFLKTEIRGYEEGSRFIVVFRLGSMNGPIRYLAKLINRKHIQMHMCINAVCMVTSVGIVTYV